MSSTLLILSLDSVEAVVELCFLPNLENDLIVSGFPFLKHGF